MTPTHLAILASVTLTLAANRAGAQEALPASPAPTAPAAPAAAPAGAAALNVRLHVTTFRGKGKARVSVQRPDGAYAFVCESPCTVDVPASSELRVTLGNEEDAHTFVVPATLGPEIDVEVRPPPVGALVGSIVLMGAGGGLVLSGLLLVALSDALDTTSGTATSRSLAQSTSDAYKTTGYVMVGIGGAAALAGFIWFVSRSHEPRVFDSPYRSGELQSRRDVLLGDVASLHARDMTTGGIAPAPAVLPLQYGFSF